MRKSYTEGEKLTREDIGLVFMTRGGKQWKIVGIPRIGVLLVNKEQDDYLVLDANGDTGVIDKTSSLKNHDLVSFVGPDFTEDKKPRKFEFDGYIIEHSGGDFFMDKYAIPKAIGNSCSAPYIRKETPIWDDSKCSKWKFTMEEILE